jgi:hypothetical protein
MYVNTLVGMRLAQICNTKLLLERQDISQDLRQVLVDRIGGYILHVFMGRSSLLHLERSACSDPNPVGAYSDRLQVDIIMLRRWQELETA